MTQTPEEEETKTLAIKADARRTEMGVEITAHSKAANVTVEIDLDYEPDYVYAVLQLMPQIMNDQMVKLADEED